MDSLTSSFGLVFIILAKNSCRKCIDFQVNDVPLILASVDCGKLSGLMLMYTEVPEICNKMK